MCYYRTKLKKNNQIYRTKNWHIHSEKNITVTVNEYKKKHYQSYYHFRIFWFFSKINKFNFCQIFTHPIPILYRYWYNDGPVCIACTRWYKPVFNTMVCDLEFLDPYWASPPLSFDQFVLIYLFPTIFNFLSQVSAKSTETPAPCLSE